MKTSSKFRPRKYPSLISFICPVFDEEEVLPMLKARLEALVGLLQGEVEWIFINDGSEDSTEEFLSQWADRDSRVKVINLSRNFGHQVALTAGVDHARGEVVIIMDADLQDPPELAIQMIEQYCKGYDIVFAKRSKRHGEGFFKRFTAAAFYWLMKRFVHPDLPEGTGDFRLMSRDAALALRQLREGQRFVRGMVTWLGFRQCGISFERPARMAGKTKYPLYKMLKFAWDAILSFSVAPLRLGSYLGLLMTVAGLLLSIYYLVRQVVYHDLVPGWATLIALNAVLGGTVLLSIGLIGEYVGRIYEEVKNRPIYIVRDKINISVQNIASKSVSKPTTLIVQKDGGSLNISQKTDRGES